MDVQIVAEPGRKLAAHRFDADPETVSGQIGQAFSTVARHLGRASIPASGPALAVYEPHGLSFSVVAGFVITDPLVGDGEVIEVVLPPGELLQTLHVGTYDELGEAYAVLRDAARALHRALDDHLMWEEYLTGPDVPPADTRTLVSWPLVRT